MTDAPPVASSEALAAIERAVRRAAAGAITADEAYATVLRAIAERRVSSTPRERMAQRSARLLAEYDSLGGDRSAASKVAWRHSDDPLERDHIAQHIRRLVRRRKTNPVRLPG